MVIENHPRLRDGSPFPTLFWLTCPVLTKRIGTIEASGWMNSVNDRLTSEADVRQRFADALQGYRDRRDTHDVVEDSGAPPGGGPDRVKCVHAHVAHELVMGGNPVGSAALADVGFPDCVAPCFSVEAGQ